LEELDNDRLVKEVGIQSQMVTLRIDMEGEDRVLEGETHDAKDGEVGKRGGRGIMHEKLRTILGVYEIVGGKK